jgi:hypothetical protein
LFFFGGEPVESFFFWGWFGIRWVGVGCAHGEWCDVMVVLEGDWLASDSKPLVA